MNPWQRSLVPLYAWDVEKEEKSRIAAEKDRKDFIAWKVALLRTEYVKEHGEFEEDAEAPWAKTQEEKVESTLKTWEGHMDLPLPFGDNKGKGVLKYKEPKDRQGLGTVRKCCNYY